ncbi:hypothetical protein P3102_10855 [Amycolatopsis sp. QT-25]|uniref:aromatic-ring hydroxylase C-terminal domain-containing protein n=1 Tax=Amycolatopsis sp. QT-25 TaxID=3034022 RepID=UPI0023EB46B2|nr:hypothetical protein [Amycolatopsis sp. QT-25]WET81664.1 hypothetical protein P3102_10855 [Amycolatopsis sp. QT-25]
MSPAIPPAIAASRKPSLAWIPATTWSPIPAHPWLGRLAPDFKLSTGTDDTDLATLLAPGRGVLLDPAPDDDLRRSAKGWIDRVDIIDATCTGHLELRAILLRPHSLARHRRRRSRPRTPAGSAAVVRHCRATRARLDIPPSLDTADAVPVIERS